MNGVVVDDMRFHERAWMAFAARHGRALSTDEFRREMSGRRNRDKMRRLFGEALSDAEAAAYQDEKEQAYRDAFRPYLTPVSGLAALLVAAREGGLRIALVTSAPGKNIDFVLDGLDLRGRFDLIVGEAQVGRSKPDPEIYLTAASRLDVEAPECVVFEDSLVGIASGQAASMPVVGVTTTHSAEELRHCALVIADFRGLTLARLAQLA